MYDIQGKLLGSARAIPCRQCSNITTCYINWSSIIYAIVSLPDIFLNINFLT